MNAILEFMQEPLGRFLWLSTLVFLIVAVVSYLGRSLRAHVRHALWLSALLPFLIPVVWLLPDRAPIEVSHAGVRTLLDPARALSPPSPVVEPGELITVEGSVAATDNMNYWNELWLLGSSFLAMWLIAQSVRLARLTTEPVPSRVRALWDEIAESRGFRRTVALGTCDAIAGPLAFGLFRTKVLLPTNLLNELKEAELESILTHELIHLERRDLWVCWLTSLICVIWFFHPVVWLLARRIRVESELRVDEDLTEGTGVDKMTYGRTLIKVARNSSSVALATTLSSGARELETRLIRLKRRPHGGWGFLPPVLVVLVSGVMLLSPAAAFDGLDSGEFAQWAALEAKLRSIEVPTVPGDAMTDLAEGNVGAIVSSSPSDAFPIAKAVQIQTSGAGDEEILAIPVREVPVEVIEEIEVEEGGRVGAESRVVNRRDIHLVRNEDGLSFKAGGQTFRDSRELLGYVADESTLTLYAMDWNVTVGDVATLAVELMLREKSLNFGGLPIERGRMDTLEQTLLPFASTQGDIGSGPEVLLMLDEGLPWSRWAEIMQTCGTRNIMNPRMALVVRDAQGRLGKIRIYLPVDVGVSAEPIRKGR